MGEQCVRAVSLGVLVVSAPSWVIARTAVYGGSNFDELRTAGNMLHNILSGSIAFSNTQTEMYPALTI
jgi:hypothetical protein